MNLQETFLTAVKGHRSSIADFIEYCERQELTVTDRIAMLERVRSIAEAATAYGYTKMTEASRAFEEGLLANTSREALVGLARALYDTCHEALIVLPSNFVHPPSSGRRLFGHAEKPLLLIADDDRAVCAIVTNLFRYHARIMEAADGMAAMDTIRLHHPDLVLLDDTMPAMSGLMLIEKMHADPEIRHIHVIMLASGDGERDRARVLEAGACDYIIKPFDPMALHGKVLGFFRCIGRCA